MADVEVIPPEARHQVPRVMEALATVPWAITDDALEMIRAVASRENDIKPEALEAYRSRRLANTMGVEVRGGVGIMRVTGPIFRYASFFTAISGGETYEAMAADLTTAVHDPNIRAVLFHWDSPGGEVNGCAEFAAMVRSYAALKPIESYVGGQCCSAAYWIASATSKITIDRTAMLGSIGVKMALRDSSERDAKSGVKTIEFVSSRAPNKRMDLASDEGRARIQRMADQTEDVFLADVAANRGLTVDEVVSKFGGGGVEIGSAAVTAGMADGLGNFEATLSRLAAGDGRTLTGRTAVMSTAPGAPVFTHTQAQVDQAKLEGQAEATKKGAADAQARIGAILGSDAGKANRTLAEHFAFKTDMTAEAAEAALVAAGPAATTAPAPATTTTTAAAPAVVEGDRSKDVAGGLALSQQQEKPGTQPEKKAPAFSASAVYANRQAQQKAALGH